VSPESPKSRFQKTPSAKKHLDLVLLPEVQQAIDATLLQMQQNYGTSTNQADAAAIQLRMEGAQSFARNFLTLADKPEAPKPQPSGNLTE